MANQLKAEITNGVFENNQTGEKIEYTALTITNKENGYTTNIKGLSKEQKMLLGMKEIKQTEK